MTHLRPVAASLSLALALALAAPTARAGDPREQQLAQALFDEARQLMEAKRYADACPKLAESQRLDPGGGTLLNLAVCHEKEGKVASAQAEFNDALSLAIRDGRKERQDLARERLAALDAKVPRVSVVVAPEADVEGIEVKLDGLVLRRAAWGVATPVDPGLHHVEATAPGVRAWRVDVPVELAERKSVRVPAFTGLAPLPPPAPLPGAGTPTVSIAPPTFTVESPTEKPRMNPLFYVTIGVAVVGGVVAAVTGELALSASSTAKDGCNFDRHYCKDQASIDAASRARTMAWVSTGALVAGVIGGVGILVIPATRSSVRVGFAPGPGGGALDLRGSF